MSIIPQRTRAPLACLALVIAAGYESGVLPLSDGTNTEGQIAILVLVVLIGGWLLSAWEPARKPILASRNFVFQFAVMPALAAMCLFFPIWYAHRGGLPENGPFASVIMAVVMIGIFAFGLRVLYIAWWSWRHLGASDPSQHRVDQ